MIPQGTGLPNQESPEAQRTNNNFIDSAVGEIESIESERAPDAAVNQTYSNSLKQNPSNSDE